jgi:hypothetical protein
VDLAGLSSIEVNMRTYGGSQYCNLDVKAGEQQVATIVATNGKTLTDYTWTNSASLTGTSPLTFSTNYGSGKGIGITSVTINATGAGTTYSRYMTQCQDITEVSTLPVEAQPRKLLINGQLYIQVNGRLYNVLGN